MIGPPIIPKDGDPLRSRWGQDLINWIKDSVAPRGDNITTRVSGNTIIAMQNKQTGDTYNGWFKVIQTSDNTIKVVDGMDENAATESATACYSGLINKINKDIPATEVTITQSGVIYLEVVPIYTNDIVSGWTCTFKHAASMPNYENKKAFILISRVTFASGKITKFSRENVALPLTVRGDC